MVKVVSARDGAALYFSRSPIPFERDATGEFDKTLYWRHIGVYAYRRSFLERMVEAPPSQLELAESLEQLRALNIGAQIKVIATDHAPVGVDTEDDLARMKEMVTRMKGNV